MGQKLRTGPLAGTPSTEDVVRRRLSPLPYIVLALGLICTGWLTLDRQAELDSLQQQTELRARQEFLTRIENSSLQIHAEIDRLTELIVAIEAFAISSDRPTVEDVAEYLRLSGAQDRFPALDGVLVIDLDSAGAPVATEIDVRSAASVSIESGIGGTPDRTLASVADPDTRYPQLTEQTRLDSTGEPFLSSIVWNGVDVTAVTSVLQSTLGSGSTHGSVSLLFDQARFPEPELEQHDGVTISLINTGTSSSDLGGIGSGADTAVEMNEVRGLTSDRQIDVLGTGFVIRASSSPGFVTVQPRTELWALAGAGTGLAFALFAALRSSIRSSARALETARSATAARAAIDRRFRASFESSPIGMAELDGKGNLVAVNEAMCRQVGLDRTQALGLPLSALVYEPDRPVHEAHIGALLDGTTDSSQSEHRFRHDDNRDTWVTESVSVIESAKSGGRSLLVQSQDITAQRRAAWELAQQALHDDLTGLPNRALFLNRLKHSLQRAHRSGEQLGVMFIDIDRFKVINDSLGHEMGDEFLVQLASRIGTALRTGDTVARFGGDEFVVLCESISGESEALAVAQRIQASFAPPFLLGQTPTYASASIGITLTQHDEESADSLLRDADAAMYRAKDGGRNRTEVFDHSMRSIVVARMEIESQLRTALKNGEIVMHYQAIVDPHTFEPAGFEALIRWNHPDKGLLGPAAFLPVAEEAGLIHLVDSFALRESCSQIAQWLELYPAARDLYVATNWSARHLGRFVQQVEQVLAETGVDAKHLVIEVTEGFLLEDSDASLIALEQLKAIGVRIAIDDFGTGYSSLSYLTRFDVDLLKIDQSFVSKLPEDAASAAVIGAIADMASRLGIRLVAEGVETDEQIQMLSTLGTPYMQGYRFAKPRPASDIELQLMSLGPSGLLSSSLS